MHSAKSITDLFKAVQQTMELVNEQMTEQVMKQMSENQLQLLDEARKATSTEELKKMSNKLVDLNEKIRQNAT